MLVHCSVICWSIAIQSFAVALVNQFQRLPLLRKCDRGGSCNGRAFGNGRGAAGGVVEVAWIGGIGEGDRSVEC